MPTTSAREYVASRLREAPPLTPEQRDRLATLLHEGGGRRHGHTPEA